MLKNAEYLITDNYKAINEETLLNISNFKEFHFYQKIDDLILDLEKNSIKFNSLKDGLIHFMNRKRSLKLNELKVFFLGIQLFDNVNKISFDGLQQYIDRLDYEGNVEKFYMNNYNRLKDNLLFIHEIDYSNIMVDVIKIPTNYFKKFNNLNYVKSIGQIINQEHFLEFLKNIKNLKRLHLQYPNLSQSIYDRLSVSCSLILFRLIENEDYQLNFDFIAKFNELKSLSLILNISLEVVKLLISHYSLVKTLNFEFSSYVFKFKNILFDIMKKQGNKFNLMKSNDLVKENVSSNEIINYFEQLN